MIGKMLIILVADLEGSDEIMNFTYRAYGELISLLRVKKYHFSGYHGWEGYPKTVILRHDIDYDIEKAVEMAKLEYAHGIMSTYFVLMAGEFYNVFSSPVKRKLQLIRKMGHDIGLHFDEACYDAKSDMVRLIEYELDLLSGVMGEKILAVSMHRPSNAALQEDWSICGGRVANSYGRRVFQEFKYCSDSRRHWRENVENVIRSGDYPRLQILTHAFWYYEEEQGLGKTVESFIYSGMLDRYDKLDRNFTDLKSVVQRDVFASGEGKG